MFWYIHLGKGNRCNHNHSIIRNITKFQASKVNNYRCVNLMVTICNTKPFCHWKISIVTPDCASFSLPLLWSQPSLTILISFIASCASERVGNSWTLFLCSSLSHCYQTRIAPAERKKQCNRNTISLTETADSQKWLYRVNSVEFISRSILHGFDHCLTLNTYNTQLNKCWHWRGSLIQLTNKH